MEQTGKNKKDFLPWQTEILWIEEQRCTYIMEFLSLFKHVFCIFTGGESAWGEAFKDEFKPNLIHQGKKDE